eukprot:gene37092-50039_t
MTTPAEKQLTLSAEKRLKVLQSLDSLGAGFQLASHDLDQRGGGNLLGDEQSGHIKEIGVELYQQMLEDAVAELRQRQGAEALADRGWSPLINTGAAVMIPEAYVLSFLIIAVFWISNRDLFARVVRVDRWLTALTLAMLCLVAVIPACAHVVYLKGNSDAAFSFYALTMALCGALNVTMWAYASFTPGIMRDEVPRAYRRQRVVASLIMPLLFGILFTLPAAQAVNALVPLAIGAGTEGPSAFPESAGQGITDRCPIPASCPSASFPSFQRCEIDMRCQFERPVEMCLRHQVAQILIARLVLRVERDPVDDRLDIVGHVGPRQPEHRADHRLHAGALARIGKGHRGIEPVAIGQCDRRETKFLRALGD